ncbi:hypothetical protein JXO52_04055 [bacterium]|nr:hypothetical protein [bacterium]
MKRCACSALLAALLLFACYKGNGLDPVSGGEDRAGIRGHISYTGAWPDSTREVRIAVMKSYPEGISDPDSLLAFMIEALNTGQLFFSDTLTRFIGGQDYECDVEPGEYEWILAAWFPDITLFLTGVKQLGAYSDDPARTHTPVRVMPGSFTEQIDMEADLDRAAGDVIFY